MRILLVRLSWAAYQCFYDSCFAHAIALATKAFVSALMPAGIRAQAAKARQESGATNTTPVTKSGEGEDDKLAEELLNAAEEAIKKMLTGSEEQKLLLTLLLKIRAFVAKASSFGFLIYYHSLTFPGSKISSSEGVLSKVLQNCHGGVEEQ